MKQGNWKLQNQHNREKNEGNKQDDVQGDINRKFCVVTFEFGLKKLAFEGSFAWQNYWSFGE